MPLATLTCTEHDLGSLITCLQCVSGDDLTAFEVKLLLQLTNQNINPQTVNELMCVNCHSDLDLQRMETALLAELAVARRVRSSWSTQALRDETNCFKCTDPHILRAAKLLLLCTFLKML